MTPRKHRSTSGSPATHSADLRRIVEGAEGWPHWVWRRLRPALVMAPLRPLAIGLSADYAKRLAGCTRTTRVSRSRSLIGVPPAKHVEARTSTVASTARSPQGVCGPCDVCPAPAVPLGDPIRHRGPTRRLEAVKRQTASA